MADLHLDDLLVIEDTLIVQKPLRKSSLAILIWALHWLFNTAPIIVHLSLTVALLAFEQAHPARQASYSHIAGKYIHSDTCTMHMNSLFWVMCVRCMMPA